MRMVIHGLDLRWAHGEICFLFAELDIIEDFLLVWVKLLNGGDGGHDENENPTSQSPTRDKNSRKDTVGHNKPAKYRFAYLPGGDTGIPFLQASSFPLP